MQKMRILNRFGLWEYIAWDFNPEKNPEAKEKAEQKLKKLGIIGKIYEVAPLCFWYSTDNEKINCGLYDD